MLMQLAVVAAYAIVFALALFFASVPLLGVLQQEGYRGRSLLRWFFAKGNLFRRRYALLALTQLLLGVLLALCFSFAGADLALLAGGIACTGLSALFAYASRRALKVPLKKTPRIVRLSVVFYLVLALAFFGLGAAALFAGEASGHWLAAAVLRAAFPALVPLLLPVLLVLASFCILGYEIPHEKRFERRAARTLAESPCLKVGITGSFGKTSVKHAARDILSAKFRVIATPASYNTPAGIARTVNEGGCDCDIFLAEMGARRRGDIAALCAMVKPTVGVVTGVCAQHLESFGSLEAIRAEKGVLASVCGRTVLGETADFGAEGAFREGVDFAAEDVVCTTEGTRFTLRIGEDRAPVSTRLLGRHAAEDIALAAALASLLGMAFSEIVAAIPAVKPVPHRLELIPGDVNVLDDSYNSNVPGARDAVHTLRLFGGKKYVVTPGLVELGQLEEAANEELGAELVGLDGVLLVGETLVLAVRRGYLAAGGDEGKLRVVPTLGAAQDVLAAELSAGDSVLFLNDLPDKYAK